MLSPECLLERDYCLILVNAGLLPEEIGGHLDLGDWVLDKLFRVPQHAEIPLDHERLVRILSKIREHPFLAGGMHAYIQASKGQLDASLRRTGVSLPFPLYAGEFPTHDFNACVRRVEHGGLVLLNSGLIFFLHHAEKLLSFVAVTDVPRQSDGMHSAAALPSPGTLAEVLWQENDPKISREVVAHLLANLLITYFFLDLQARPKIPVLPSFSQFVVSSLLSQETTKFVLAHEYGHVLAGHLETREAIWQQEFEADAAGLEFLIECQNAYTEQPEDIRMMQADASLCAPLFFLALDELISKVLSDELIAGFCAETKPEILPQVLTHPPSNVRTEHIKKRLKQLQPTAGIAIAASYTAAVASLSDIVVTTVRSWVLDIVATG